MPRVSKGLQYPYNLAADLSYGVTISNDQIDGINYLVTNILSDQEQEAVLMYYKEHMTMRQIAALWCVSYERVYQVLYSARARLSSHQYADYIKYGYAENMMRIAQEKEERAKIIQNAIERIRTAEKTINCDITIKYLRLQYRVYNALARANINTIGQLEKMSDRELYKIRGLGSKGVHDIRQALKEMEA